MSGFESFFNQMPNFDGDRSDNALRAKLLLKSMEMAAILKQQIAALEFMSRLLVEKNIVVERGFNPSNHPRTREIEGFVVHYNSDMPPHLLMMFQMILDTEFEGVMPSYSEFAALITRRETEINQANMPETVRLAGGDNPLSKLMPLYCVLLDERESSPA